MLGEGREGTVAGDLQSALPNAPTWLCPAVGDRERLVDMEARLRPVRTLSFAALAVALIAGGPWVGWWTLIPLAVAAAGFRIVDRSLADTPYPEYQVALAWLLSQGLIAVSVALTGGPHSPALSWLVIPVVTLPARFNTRGVLAGVGVTVAALLIVTLGLHPDEVVHRPQNLIFALALVAAVCGLSVALMRSDLEHRSEAVIDPLTGMLNRNALATRAAEITAQAKISRQPVSIIIADLDHFKAVNDQHGHAAGDGVLQEAAYRMRSTLRAYDLAYRLGGEEFLVLLPGAQRDDALGLAEEMRTAIAREPMAGLAVTASFGVATSSPGAFDYTRVFTHADHALYAAKRAGRNTVVGDGSDELASTAAGIPSTS